MEAVVAAAPSNPAVCGVAAANTAAAAGPVAVGVTQADADTAGATGAPVAAAAAPVEQSAAVAPEGAAASPSTGEAAQEAAQAATPQHAEAAGDGAASATNVSEATRLQRQEQQHLVPLVQQVLQQLRAAFKHQVQQAAALRAKQIELTGICPITNQHSSEKSFGSFLFAPHYSHTDDDSGSSKRMGVGKFQQMLSAALSADSSAAWESLSFKTEAQAKELVAILLQAPEGFHLQCITVATADSSGASTGTVARSARLRQLLLLLKSFSIPAEEPGAAQLVSLVSAVATGRERAPVWFGGVSSFLRNLAAQILRLWQKERGLQQQSTPDGGSDIAAGAAAATPQKQAPSGGSAADSLLDGLLLGGAADCSTAVAKPEVDPDDPWQSPQANISSKHVRFAEDSHCVVGVLYDPTEPPVAIKECQRCNGDALDRLRAAATAAEGSGGGRDVADSFALRRKRHESNETPVRQLGALNVMHRLQ
ncbi:hypothetical protein cyc_05054 [Cyclospora cayetanensis]|uniref:Uncharacterized protein n=1 Tax=Cyclospora cayetanensis TaxID=88456 RepID=A0A1D3D3S1_9EIME|nr:hypothetical protein cyc_05054 [Cyclospora cayetanensis]